MSTLAPLLVCALTGCASTGGNDWTITPPWKKAPEAKAKGPADTITLTGGGGLKREEIDDASRIEFDAAKRLYDEKKYAQAEPMFHKLVRFSSEPRWLDFGIFGETKTKDKKDAKARRYGGDPLTEAALFYESECQRLQKNYRTAAESYTKLLVSFPNTQYTNPACQGLFEIAHHWLGPTAKQMDEYHEQLQGKRSFVMPAMYFHFEKEMPFLDAEGHATQILNTIRLHNIKGPMAEKALFMLGTINFFRKEYKEADFYFTQLFEQHPNSEHAAKAVRQSIICKQLSTGGTSYDLRPVEESKKLLMTMQGAYPELAKDRDWAENQLKMMNLQQADRDFKIAEFYRRTGHPGSAYFYYELVIRRYPRTEFATKAAERKNEMKSKVEREQQEQGMAPAQPAPVPPGLQGTPAVPPRTLPPGLERQ